MDIIRTTNKAEMLNTIEKLYIHKETNTSKQINDKCTIKPSIIFDTLIQTDTDGAHSASTQPVSSIYISVTNNTHAITHAGTSSSLHYKTVSTHAHLEFFQLKFVTLQFTKNCHYCYSNSTL
jgi:hypothetical protein